MPIVASNIRPFSFAADFPAVHLLDPEDTAEYARALVLALGEGRAQRPLGGLTLADTAERYLAVARQVTRGMATVVAIPTGLAVSLFLFYSGLTNNVRSFQASFPPTSS